MDCILFALSRWKNFSSIIFLHLFFCKFAQSYHLEFPAKGVPKEQCKLFLMYSVVYRRANPKGAAGGDPVLKGTSFFYKKLAVSHLFAFRIWAFTSEVRFEKYALAISALLNSAPNNSADWKCADCILAS